MRIAMTVTIIVLCCAALCADTLREVLRAANAPGMDQTLPNLDKPSLPARQDGNTSAVG